MSVISSDLTSYPPSPLREAVRALGGPSKAGAAAGGLGYGRINQCLKLRRLAKVEPAKALAAAARRKGFLVHPWTLMEPDEYRVPRPRARGGRQSMPKLVRGRRSETAVA